eukprot:CAMPEP_0183296814 /NCGR_PEP_ID=MMETSP0160_2-20130417/4236_1 /TAXON_ID=2839 ORGANISM="Odontella Sinensis, Strain Grunow 1884" /NCGR_SAMPLE_ID=MMETSP0160_2 /ASSEMBLY_ACC=CAM_ASM_000250 /LENGTH=212 /DNA_ID=CAMNT_0025458491 /DNA_START=67 /DNA_END=705 /DNA_ORIENTATION=+
MKVAFCFAALVASASAFAPQASEGRASVALEAESSRRQAVGTVAAAAAAFLPAAANAAVGESPRFSVFGVIGDGTSYSEGAAYGSDQSAPVYSPYSVYSEAGEKSVYKPGTDADIARKNAILVESRKRLGLLPAYIEKKQWFNVKDELTRYMYETRGAVRGLASSTKQKEKADDFFKAIEETYLQAGLKNQGKCAAAAAKSVEALDAFTASL